MKAFVHLAITLLRQIGSFGSLLFSNFSSSYIVLVLAILVLLLEYVATSLMIPMAPGQTASNSAVLAVWTTIAAKLGMEPVTKTWLWLFFVVMIARLAFGYVLTVLTAWLGKRLHRAMNGKIFSHILRNEPMSQVYMRSVGYYITLAGDDTFRVGTIVATMLQTVIGLSTALVGLVVLFQFSVPIFLGVSTFLLASLALTALLLRRMVRVNNRVVGLSREIGTTFIESLNSLRSIRSLQTETFVIRTYSQQIRTYVKMLVEMEAIKSGVRTFPAIALLLLAAVLMRPGQEVGISEASIFAATIIIIRIFASLGQMATAGTQLLTELRALRDVRALVDLADMKSETDSQAAPDADAEPLLHVSSIRLDKVAYGYGARGLVLDNVNFEFKAGHTYAIVGPSGAGKSTLADLLLGLDKPSGGAILVNADTLPHFKARHRIALVEQQPKIFSTTLKENLLLGTTASDTELLGALQDVDLSDMVRSLPAGMETRVSYLGENFSGGQRQRLGIARALVRDPDVLILDEATSALDPDTRRSIVDRLRTRMKDGIIIFITHDMEIAQLADEVLRINALPSGTSRSPAAEGADY